MQDFKKLIELLKDGIVTFRYTKSDREKRVTNGTLNEKGDDGDEFRLEKKTVDTIVAMKYSSIEEYLSANKIILVKEENGEYVFRHMPRKTNENISTSTKKNFGRFRKIDL